MTTFLFSASIEIEAESEEVARATFDAFREAVVPSDHGVTLWDLNPNPMNLSRVRGEPNEADLRLARSL